MTQEDKSKLQDMLQGTYHMLENLGSIFSNTSELMDSNKDIHETNRKYLDEISSGMNLIEDADGKLLDIISSASEKVLENPGYAKASLSIAENIINVEKEIVNKVKVNAEACRKLLSIGIDSCQHADKYKTVDVQIVQICKAILDLLNELNNK